MPSYTEVYAEKNAELAAISVVPTTREKTAVRRWRENLPDGSLAAVIKEMDDSILYVDNPYGSKRGEDGAEYKLDAGRWRVSRHRLATGDEPIGIYQELRWRYLQDPAQTGASPAAWSAIDAEARIFRVTLHETTVETAFGTHYVVVYPGVARKTVREFCAALLARGNLSNPTFDAHAALTGTFRFQAVRNEEQDDGHSIVVGILVDITSPTGFEHKVYDGCDFDEWLKFFYDLPSLPAVPASTSGVSYRLENVNIDRESGLYSCTLVTRSQNTQTIALHTVAQDVFEKRERVIWIGVRDGDIDNNGAAIPLETTGNPSAGVLVEISRSKNSNCTQDITQAKTTDQAVSDAVLAGTKTIFEYSAEDVDRNQPAATDITVPVASGGVVTTKRGEKTASGLLNITTKTDTEQAVSNASVSGTKTVFEHVAEDTDRGQPADTDLTVPAAANGVVTTKSGEKTPGGLLTVRTRTGTEQAVTDATVSGTKTIYESTTESVDKSQPLDTDLTVPAAADGVVTTKKGEKTPGGLLDVTERVTTEHAVSSATTTETKTVFESSVSETDQNQPADTDLTVPAATGGAVVTKSSRKTPGGLLDVTTKTDTEQAVSDAVVSGTKTLFEHVASDVDKAQDPATDLSVPAAASGVVTTKTGRKTPGGLLDVETRTETEQAVTDAERTVEVRANLSIERTLDRSQSAAGSDPTTPGTSKTVRKTNGALFDIQETSHTPTEALNTFTIPTIDGNIIVKHFEHYQKATLDSLCAALNPFLRNNLSFSEDELGRWSGTLTTYPLAFQSMPSVEKYEETGITEEVSSFHERNGRIYKVTKTSTYDVKKDEDADAGWAEYKAKTARKEGSFFRNDLRNDFYIYKVVTAIVVNITDVTEDFTNGGEITF